MLRRPYGFMIPHTPFAALRSRKATHAAEGQEDRMFVIRSTFVRRRPDV